ncbi:hypothetical protein SRHO_G00161320 [Serrasalmus rhombeus]
MEGADKTEGQQTHEMRSVISSSSLASKRSAASMAAAQARARAEAARARASFIDKETAVRLEKVRMEGTLMAIQQEKEVAAALAEAKVFEEAAELNFGGSQKNTSINLPAVDPKEHTSNYVEQHFQTQAHQCPPLSPIPQESYVKQEDEAHQVQAGSEPSMPSLSFYGESAAQEATSHPKVAKPGELPHRSSVGQSGL